MLRQILAALLVARGARAVDCMDECAAGVKAARDGYDKSVMGQVRNLEALCLRSEQAADCAEQKCRPQMANDTFQLQADRVNFVGEWLGL